MARISFEDLYSENPQQGLGVFLIWAQSVLEGLEIPSVNLSPDKAQEYLSNLRKEDFPANGGFDAASPFKKAANAYVWLMALNPFSGLGSSHIGEMSKYVDSTASLLGFGMVQECLHGATLTRRDGEVITLKNPIMVSDHFIQDFVEASRGIVPQQHYKVFSLLFESLAYEANPGASYSKVI